VRIVAATEADLAPIAALDVWLVAPQRQRSILRESIANGGCYVALCEESVAGFVTWDHGFLSRPFVRLLVVGRAFRRRGVGRALLARVERAAQVERELFVSTEERNGPMRAMLAAANYEPSGSVDHINPPGNAELIYFKRL
jgi:GNAT superfamily N-acetyltransferase